MNHLGNPLYRERYRECRDSLEKPCIELPQSLIQRASTQVPTQVPFVPFVFTFLPRQAALPEFLAIRLIASTCRITCRIGRVRHPAAPPARQRSLPGRATCPALKPRQAAEPPLFPGFLLYVLYVLYLTRQAAEPPLSPGSLLYVLYVLYLTRQAAEPPLSPGSLLYVLYVLYLTRQAAEHPLSPGSLLYVLYVLYLTRQAAEPPLSPGSLLYVLYVLYILYARKPVVYVLYRAI